MSSRNLMTTCPQCGEQFKEVGKHWYKSPTCDYPDITTNQKEIITGILMGDGTLEERNNSKKCRIGLDMVTRPYLMYLDKIFGPLGTGVTLHDTAEERAEHNRKTGFSPSAQTEDYHDVYRWRIRSHPSLGNFTHWYPEGDKVWPRDINLTPTVLKHFFVGDGTKHPAGYIAINVSNERDNRDKVDGMFENSGLPRPNRWDHYNRKNGSAGCSIVWTVEQSKKLWKYMGPPLPGFEYKWPK